MSHAAQLSGLTDELVNIIAGYSPGNDADAFRGCKEFATRKLRSHRFVRTNQFQVRSSLAGLVDKFEIWNEDRLAERLRSRLRNLETKQYRWKPEVLSLLLLLSDKPVTKTRVVDVEEPNQVHIVPSLTWNDVIASDPIIDTELWIDVERGSPKPFEDEVVLNDSVISNHTDDTWEPGEAEGDIHQNTGRLVMPINTITSHKLKVIQASSQRSVARAQIRVTELQVIREVLHALLGLPSRFCNISEWNEKSAAFQGFSFDHASRVVMGNLMSAFTTIVADLHLLRIFCGNSHTIPLMQTFSASIDRRLQDFDSTITKIEQYYVGIEQTAFVSLLNVYTEVNMHTAFIPMFAKMVSTVENLADDLSFRLLDQLYDCACVADALEPKELYHVATRTFFDCLNTYIKPLNEWMDDGYLDPKAVLCPFMITGKEELSKFWSDRFAIHYLDGRPKAPRFLQEVLPEIFASGKDVAFSRALGLADMITAASSSAVKSFEIQLRHEVPDFPAPPFSTFLGRALREWILNKRHKTWRILRDVLIGRFGLWRTISSLGLLYLSSDGHMAQTFSEAIFMRLDSNRPDWDSPFVLEEILGQAFCPSQFIRPECLHLVRNPKTTLQPKRTMKGLEHIVFDFHYPWPIENIIPPSTLKTYQRIFTFLLQIDRAKSVLSHQTVRILSICNKTINSKRVNYSLRTASCHHDLRHRSLWLITTLQNYLFQSAIAPTSLELQKTMQIASSIDEMIMSHSRFVSNIAQGCLLAHETVSCHGALLSLLDLTMVFADIGKRIAEQEEGTNCTAHELKGSNEIFNLKDNHQVEQLRSQFYKLLAYTTTGLRNASRTPGASPMWEVLAEMLELGMSGP